MGRRKEKGKWSFPSASSYPLLLLFILAFLQGESKKIFRIFINIVEYVKTCTVPVLPYVELFYHTHRWSSSLVYSENLKTYCN